MELRLHKAVTRDKDTSSQETMSIITSVTSGLSGAERQETQL